MPNTIKYKYDEVTLRKVVSESVSIREVMTKIGIKVISGGMHSHITKQVKRFGIDTSHFYGKTANRGENHKGGNAKLTASQILVVNTNGYKTKSSLLRRALNEIGIPCKCSNCGISEWNGKYLRLEVEHKNGDSMDCRKENLCYLCPNCHSQTETYCRMKTSQSAGMEYRTALRAVAP